MKVAIYNRYWKTFGGGEKYSGFVAQCLAEKHQVDLLVHEPLDRALIQERLDVDLTGVGVRIIPDEDDVCFNYETSKYDLLVNSTFGSDAFCAATYGLYICYFPVPHSPIKTAFGGFVERMLMDKASRPHTYIDWGDGWFGHEQARDVYRWSTEQPTLRVWAPKGTEAPVRIILLRLLPKSAAPTELDISIEGEVVKKVVIEPGRGSIKVDIPVPGRGLHPSLIQLNCNTFGPKDHNGSDDPRQLGVALVADQTGRPANGLTYSRRRYVHNPPLHFLESYDQVISISRYTQKWMTRLWNRQSQVINPPVTPQVVADKEPIVLSVGRFFDEAGSHCKKQAEMVIAFRSLVERGLEGWTYHVVGGCEERDLPYLRRVRELAAGLPVEFHVQTTGAELKSLYSKASIFWHATGLGDDENRFPERLEHFGITTVEAMSAGAVPIVIGKGGQPEIIEDSVQGRHFKDLPELVDRTWEIAQNDELRQRYSTAAVERAKAFSPEVFRHRLNEVVEQVLNQEKGLTASRGVPIRQASSV